MRASFIPFLFFILLLSSCVEEKHNKNAYSELVDLTQKRIFEDPQKFLETGYCYFVYQGVINPAKVTPRLFSLYVKGGSLSRSHLKKYESWLKEENGTLCQEVIGEGFEPISIPKDKEYLVLLNQKAIERDKEKVALIFQHELLHAAYAHFPHKREKVQKLWAQLTQKQQLSFKQKHAGYNFENSEVLLREYFAYSYQNRPEEGVMMLVR